jgi:succinate-semialdehyde dehydrogenase/glutarate-semialdehyde dehydrogenase
LNAGQSCVCAKRFVVTSKNVEEFTHLMREGLKAKKFGDPFSEGIDFGPLARRDLRDQLHEQVTTSVSQGSNLALGGKIPDNPGFFYPASLLTDVKPGQVAFDEELFGPVAAVIEAQDESEAFQLANRSRYGLGGAVFSKDVERAAELARTEMDTGMIAINDNVRSDAVAPFGGVKDSGLGRELGRDGTFEFTYIRSVFVKPH